MPTPGPIKHGSGGVSTADGRSIELTLNDQKSRALSDILKADSIVSGRVVERFQGDTYLINIRGQHIVAESSLSLLRDSIVKLAVLGTEGGLRLRIAEAGSQDQALTSAPNQRLAALGLPQNQTAQLVLQAFEETGAQLSPPQRVQQAFLQVADAQGKGASQSQQVQLATAHALLAEAKIPASPALVQLAQRAVRGDQNQVAQTLSQLLPTNIPQVLRDQSQQQTLAQETANRFNAALLPRGNQASGAVPTGIANQAPSPHHNLAQGSLTHSSVSSAAPQRTTGNPNTPQVPPGAQAPSSTASNQHMGLNPGEGQASIGAEPPRRPPSSTQQLAELIHQHDLNRNPKLALRNALEGLGISIREHTPSDTAAAPLPSNEQRPPPNPVHTSQMLAMPITADPIPVEVELGSLLRRMVDISQSFTTDGPSFNPSHALAREILSDALLPPRALADYDLVIPFPLFTQQQPIPARLALSERKHGSTEATFMRIDVELSQLGPLSLRFTEVSGNPIGITIFHTPQSHAVLHAGIDDLQNDLQAQGIETSLRLADYSDAPG